MNVLLTRPLNQVGELAELVGQFGDTPLYFPSLEIKALTPSKPVTNYNVLIFISVNAVHYAKDYLPNLIQQNPMIATVGNITQSVLENDYHIKVDCVPHKIASSKTLLELEAMKNLSHKTVLIVRGQGGLETLKNQLEKQDNHIDYLEVYQRIPAILSAQHRQSLQQFLEQKQGVIIIHSVDSFLAFRRLVEQIDQQFFNYLCRYPIILMSSRIQQVAQSYGFKKCYVVKTASHQALLESLKIVHLESIT